ncbi:MAG TPA: LCP family protein [Halanaerobiales bacterium]|nr:LCP family protein [Halanaerobiales bacterium]
MLDKLKKINLKIIGIFLLIVIVGLSIYILFNDDFSLISLNPFRKSKLNILVAGYDSSINGPPRADTIIVASVDLNTNNIGLLFIPRDTRVKVNGHGYDRINASHAYGGISLLKETVEDFLNIKLDYYVETDFQGFAEIIDQIGGLEITIEKPLHYVDKAGGLYIDLPAGNVHLDGKKALQYVRYRGSKGDIGRVARQQKFIQALMEKAISSQSIINLPSIYKEVRDSINTNIPVKDFTPFIRLAKNTNLNSLKTEMLPGRPEYINGASYWIPDEQSLTIMVNNLIRSKEYIQNDQYQITILNGNGRAGIAGEVAEELEKYGFNINKVANANNFNYQDTIIYYKDDYKKVATGLKDILGGTIEKNEEIKDDFQIILGQKFVQNQIAKKEEIN